MFEICVGLGFRQKEGEGVAGLTGKMDRKVGSGEPYCGTSIYNFFSLRSSILVTCLLQRQVKGFQKNNW